LDKTDLSHFSDRRVPLARIQCKIWDRIRRLLRPGKAVLLPKASLELEGPLSWLSSSTGR